MPEIDAEVRKWGNTLGIRVPAVVAREAGIGVGDKVRVVIEKVHCASPGFFGLAKRQRIDIDMAAYHARRERERRAEAARERRRARRA